MTDMDWADEIELEIVSRAFATKKNALIQGYVAAALRKAKADGMRQIADWLANNHPFVAAEIMRLADCVEKGVDYEPKSTGKRLDPPTD